MPNTFYFHVFCMCMLMAVCCIRNVDAEQQYLTCERDADCWTLQNQQRWCDETVRCQKGRCAVSKKGPCHVDLETCDLPKRRCIALYCAHDSGCPGGYCDVFKMRCVPGVRKEDATLLSATQEQRTAELPSDGSISFTGPGALTYYFALGVSFILAVIFSAFSFCCCIL